MLNQSNPYGALKAKELKSLKRVNKANPEAVRQIEEALEALSPYKAGRLKKEEMSLVADALKTSLSSASPDEKITKATEALAVLKQFEKQPAPAAAAPQSDAQTPALVS